MLIKELKGVNEIYRIYSEFKIKNISDRINWITLTFVPFRKKGTNKIVPRTEIIVCAESGSILLRVFRSLSNIPINPVNPVR